jgi:hypothetical protein
MSTGSPGVGWGGDRRAARRRVGSAADGALGDFPGLFCVLLAVWAFLSAAWIFLS